MSFKKITIAKKVGRNGSVTIGDERLAKVISKEDWLDVQNNIERYNDAIANKRSERTIKKYLNAIKKLMQKNKLDAAKKVAAKKAAVASIDKKASNTKKSNPVVKATKSNQSTKKVSKASKSTPRPKATSGRRYRSEY